MQLYLSVGGKGVGKARCRTDTPASKVAENLFTVFSVLDFGGLASLWDPKKMG
jgi:hypothetical protein